jgi:hypothetical protein
MHEQAVNYGSSARAGPQLLKYSISRLLNSRPAILAFLLGLTVVSILIHGYHFGQQDAAIYVPAIKKILQPSLYPYDAQFFLAQTRWMLFPQAVAWTVQATRVSLEWVVMLWHVGSIFLLLLAAWMVAGSCFPERRMRWSAVAMLCVARLLPVLGTRLELTDRYLHPRDLATAAILFGLHAVLERQLMAFAWLALAGVLHPTMALFGAWHLAFQAWRAPAVSTKGQGDEGTKGQGDEGTKGQSDKETKGQRVKGSLCPSVPLSLCLFVTLPLCLFVRPVGGDAAWRSVLASRPYLFPLRWPWYAWAGAAFSLLLLAWYASIARRQGWRRLECICRRAAWAGAVGAGLGVLVSVVPGLERLVPIEPMRVLHLVYLLCVLIGGGLLGRNLRRTALVLVLLAAVFALTGRRWSPASPHIEWPSEKAGNSWIEAFRWIPGHTPPNAFFALNPNYMLSPGEDAHGFRAFAERSMMADWVKDRSVAALDPSLAFQWQQEVQSRAGWPAFRGADFQRLKYLHRVTWIVLERGAPAFPAPEENALDCPFVNDAVAVCRIAEAGVRSQETGGREPAPRPRHFPGPFVDAVRPRAAYPLARPLERSSPRRKVPLTSQFKPAIA